MIRTAIRTLPIRSIQPERTCPFPERLFRAPFTERLVTRRASVGSAGFPGPANAGRPVRKSRSFFATSWSLISLAADQTLAWFQHQGGDRAAAPAIQKTPPCLGGSCPRFGGGGARPRPSTGGTKARPADHASLRFDPPLSMAQPNNRPAQGAFQDVRWPAARA